VKRQSFNEINITPLTDIFLVLLIIMMVIAPMLDQQGLNLAVPDYVEAQAMQKENKILTVMVSSENKYFIDGQEVTIENLASNLEENAKVYTDGLMIEAQGDSTHGSVVKLMDVARNSGISNISITEI
jgi:biopolymer transport protein ExbD/biopolymer transport protein TolR